MCRIFNMAALVSWFWSEKFWFPHGLSWEDLKNHDQSDIRLPQLNDMHWSIVVGVVFLVIRYLYEKLVVIPVGRYFGVKERRRVKVVPNIILEAAYQKYGLTVNDNVKVLVKQTDMSKREVEKWFLHRRQQDVPDSMQKFRECSWHFTFYLSSFIAGCVILWDKPWFWQTKYCWKGWPQLNVTLDIHLYYLIELGFYWSLVFTLITDHKRKDFIEMVVHHIVTILLIYFSWTINFIHVGTLVLLVHDAADYWMAAAKMAHYCKKHKLCEGFFVMFCIVWVISRLGLYPASYKWMVGIIKIILNLLFHKSLLKIQLIRKDKSNNMDDASDTDFESFQPEDL
ncbi:hypothetical protein ACJMK2_023454 [Sinanodonta woodiana]|uniref:TLC domain-containing protein n=1 Tax=Sinanodonta woodiana TaxID=1069815 RepID=A0ABD3T4A0_SINWO